MDERVIRMLLAYDGTGFRGWAAQRDRSIRTVEGCLVDALTPVLGEAVRLSVAGRTDAGVHARGQVASFLTASPRATRAIRDAVNGRLAPEVVALSVDEAADGFDARFSATAREYRYRVDVGQLPDPFAARYVWHHPCTPDVRGMRAAARHLVGERDFSSFCRHPGPGRSTVRHLQLVRVTLRGDRLEVGFRANAFLHQMVRALTGILIAVGEGKVDPDAVPAILEARDRAAARQIAPPNGLTLERVVYGRRRSSDAAEL
ncbi:MAG TPA: tRNA pseudouridine(38-40) synthase TruA [Actinomycetota bacterium]|nr:tRNA pseudouridine(38-40) synthase TruA [Actinomycetota bacterium]